MTEVQEQQPEVAAPLERGRYAVFETPDGGLAIARSGPLCDTCAGCGCGEQADAIMVPKMAADVIMGRSEIGKMKDKLLRMVARG